MTDPGAMIRRHLEAPLRELARSYPVVVVTGPRQSGKTTLCREAFPELPYRNLEPLDQRTMAREDPRGFFAELMEGPGGAVIDEIQNVPELTSYLQVLVDEEPERRPFVLTGSHQLGLTSAVSQSLAGRAAMLHLLPPSLGELRGFGELPETPWPLLWRGAYPRIFEEGVPAGRWLVDYFEAFVLRDVRSITNVGDLRAFTRFVELCAAHTGCELNLSRLGGDAGVSHHTAKSWISILEASFLIQLVPAWHGNLRKHLVKRPKLHFLDTGLACHLLRIREPQQLERHPLRGAIFESWVAAELLKARLHRALPSDLFHLRAKSGLELDLLLDQGARIDLFEAKSGATVVPDHSAALRRVGSLLAEEERAPELGMHLVYGGSEPTTFRKVKITPWNQLDALAESL